MGCGCGGNKKAAATSAQRAMRAASTPRISPVAPQGVLGVAGNNMKPLPAVPQQLPRPSLNDAEKKARQKARQDARLRALGKI